MKSITERIDKLPSFLAPIVEEARRYLKYPSTCTNDDVMNIGHRPWIAELNYMLMLYPGLSCVELDRYSKQFKIQIPEMYSAFLREVNGAFCFGMSLCGVPLSMLRNPPLLDRSLLQCHDLAMAATKWVSGYRVPSRFFHFGSRHFSSSENVGYFIDEGQRILCIRKSGEITEEWTSFTKFLSDELQVSAKLEEELHPSKWKANSVHLSSVPC